MARLVSEEITLRTMTKVRTRAPDDGNIKF
jgi:hypothetical protein